MSHSRYTKDVKECTNVVATYAYELQMHEESLKELTSEIEFLEEQGDEFERIASLQAQCQVLRSCIMVAEDDYFNACADLWIARSYLIDELDK